MSSFHHYKFIHVLIKIKKYKNTSSFLAFKITILQKLLLHQLTFEGFYEAWGAKVEEENRRHTGVCQS